MNDFYLHSRLQFELRHYRVKVFEQPSRNQSMVLLPRQREAQDAIQSVAAQYLGQVVYIGWPHLIKAKVESVASRDQVVDRDGVRSNEPRRFDSDCKLLEEQLSYCLQAACVSVSNFTFATFL